MSTSKLVEEAPFHPGYEDAVIVQSAYTEDIIKPVDALSEYQKYKDRHISTSKKIIEFMKSGCKWER